MNLEELRYFIFTFLKGGAIGIGNIIPGVSGGTIAVIVGIYDKLIKSISNLFKQRDKKRDDLIFLIIVFTGALASIFLLSNVIGFLLQNYSNLFMFFLIGLILGSISSIIKMRRNIKFSFSTFTSFIIGVSIPILLTIFVVKTPASVKSFSNLNLYNYLFLFITGIMAGGTMVVPGISGALIMVLFGQYSTVIFSVENLLFIPLSFLALGIVIGIFGFVKLIDMLLNRFSSLTLYCIIGLVLGSCYKIFPGFSKGVILLFQFLIFVIGLSLSIILNRFSKKGSYL